MFPNDSKKTLERLKITPLTPVLKILADFFSLYLMTKYVFLSDVLPSLQALRHCKHNNCNHSGNQENHRNPQSRFFFAPSKLVHCQWCKDSNE